MLSFKTKLSYGIGGICDNALYTLSGTYLLIYLTTVAGVDPAAAGTITAVGSIWEAICGPVFGHTSDRTVTRFGRRKPFLIAAAIPVAAATTMLFTNIDAGPLVKDLYYMFAIIFFWTAFSMEFIPYMSWGADLTADYNERTVLRSYSYIFNQLGMFIGMVLPTLIVGQVMKLGKSEAFSWQATGAFVGICGALALLICAFTIHKDDIPRAQFLRKKPEHRVKTEKGHSGVPGMLREYLEILKLKPALCLVGASMMYLIANTVFSSSRVFYMTYNLAMGDRMISLMMFVITAMGIAFVPLITGGATKTDKKSVFLAGIGLSGLILIAFRFLGVNGTGTLVIICCVYTFANTCYWQLMPAMIYDVCEVDELYSGRDRTGTVISLQALSESVSIAIGFQGLGWILSASGFEESAAVQTETALSWVSNTFTLIPGIFMLLSALLIFRYPLDPKTFGRVLSALERKRSGEEAEAEDFGFMSRK